MSDSSPQLLIEDLAVLMIGELHRALQSSDLEQVRTWSGLVGTVGATEEGHVAKMVGMTPEQRAAAAQRRAQETVLPLLLAGRKPAKVITVTAVGRDYLIGEFAGLAIERAVRGGTQQETIETLLRRTRSPNGPWAIEMSALLALVEAQLVAEAREAYQLLRIAVQRGIPRLHVTSGELVTRIILSVAEEQKAPDVRPGAAPKSSAQARAQNAAGAGTGRNLRLLALVVDAQSDAAVRSPALVGSIRLEFQVSNFPEMTAI